MQADTPPPPAASPPPLSEERLADIRSQLDGWREFFVAAEMGLSLLDHIAYQDAALASERSARDRLVQKCKDWEGQARVERQRADEAVAAVAAAEERARLLETAVDQALELLCHWAKDADEYPSFAWQYRDKVARARGILLKAAAQPTEQRGTSNTLVIDTTNAQMVQMPNVNAAPSSMPITGDVICSCGSPKYGPNGHAQFCQYAWRDDRAATAEEGSA